MSSDARASARPSHGPQPIQHQAAQSRRIVPAPKSREAPQRALLLSRGPLPTNLPRAAEEGWPEYGLRSAGGGRRHLQRHGGERALPSVEACSRESR